MIVQEPDVNVQVPELLKLPPAPPSLHATEPVGVEGVPGEVSDTVTVYVIVFPMTTVDGLGATIAEVERRPEDIGANAYT